MEILKSTEPNVLSLWLGSITEFGDLDAYIWEHFENDFGIKLGPGTEPEADAQEHQTAIRELLGGFSFSQQWVDDAVSVCQAEGWAFANCAIVLFNVRYQPNLVQVDASCPMRFVGNINWEPL